MNADSIPLDERMKMYEAIEAERRFMPGVPVLARLDGRAFHTLCRKMDRPYDERMVESMREVTAKLVEESHSQIGYTQSDEITLVFYSEDPRSQIFFDGKIHKLTSVLASLASAYFAEAFLKEFGYQAAGAAFDCRCWMVPTKDEAVNCLIWRERDATKNSITQAALAHYSHKQLHGKHSGDKMDMLMAKGVNWNDYPAFFKRGSYYQRRTRLVALTEEQRAAIPEPHRPAIGEHVLRSFVELLDLPPLAQVVNRVDVVFDGAETTT